MSGRRREHRHAVFLCRSAGVLSSRQSNRHRVGRPDAGYHLAHSGDPEADQDDCLVATQRARSDCRPRFVLLTADDRGTEARGRTRIMLRLVFKLEACTATTFETAPTIFRDAMEIARPAGDVWRELVEDGSLGWCRALGGAVWTSPKPYGIGTTRTMRVAGALVIQVFRRGLFGRRDRTANVSLHVDDGRPILRARRSGGADPTRTDTEHVLRYPQAFRGHHDLVYLLSLKIAIASPSGYPSWKFPPAATATYCWPSTW